MVNSRNIEAVKSTGNTGCKFTYIDFNDSLRNYIAITGNDGEVLNTLLIAPENRGDGPIANLQLQDVAKSVPNVYEYNRATHGALQSWIIGEAKKLATYGFNGGIGAWRRLYHDCLPMDQTKQDITFIEFASMEAVKEKDLRVPLDRLEELRDKRDRCGERPLAENIVKRVVAKCLPSTSIKPIAVALDDAKTFRQIRRLVVKQMYNVVIGMMDGDVAQPLYATMQEGDGAPRPATTTFHQENLGHILELHFPLPPIVMFCPSVYIVVIL